MADNVRVGFVGLGNQGAPIAQRIIDAGYDTTLWARRAETLAPFAGPNVHVSATLAELGARCDVVGVCVYADGDVDEVASGPAGLIASMRPGSIILVHSTTHPDLCRRLATDAEKAGVILMDAPVSGGALRAAQGQMAVMLGGSKSAYEKVLPILRTYASAVEWLGPVGSGQTCKLINNALMLINLTMAFGYLESGDGLGLDRPGLIRMLSAGSAQSFALDRIRTGTVRLDFAGARLAKDVALTLDVMRTQDAANPWIDLTQRTLDAFADYARRGQDPTPV
jgi:3-hydroxyisobutyrate dehydrogenase-like beta-hydroxyacid dehydrogenase